MKSLNKAEMHKMFLEDLELHKNLLFNRLSKGIETRKIRNVLFDLLGVMDYKKRNNIETLFELA